MSFLEPKTIPLFYFTGEKATTPTCPVEMQPNLNPSSGAQSYQNADAGCTRSAKYNIPFFLENLGPTFSEWSVNAHEARPGHHTQVMPVLSLDWLSCVGCFPCCQTKQSDNSGIIQEKKKATVFDWTKFLSNKPLPLIRPPRLFQGKKVNNPPSLLSSPYPSLILYDKLYLSITTAKLFVDWSGMVYLPTESSVLILILGCMT